ncbi:MAG: ribulokinase [Candidatus Brocadiaceae bacterium]|jgi:L-ribulokinase
MPRYSIGLDFGTESVRALLLDLDDGTETAAAECAYSHGVASERLPIEGEVSLGRDWFLQDPDDYLAGLQAVVPALLEQSGADGGDVVGLGLDFTSCTVMPCDASGEPLCRRAEFRGDPQAWVKLWKHHGAAGEADHILSVARQRGEEFLDYYAGTISSEWLMPKVLETLHRSPEVYGEAFTFVEGADWVVWQLTGVLARNACCAGYKAQYVVGSGWPSEEFLSAVEPRMADLFAEKMPGEVVAPGARVGGLSPEWAERLGLPEGTPVAAPFIDAHAAVPGCGVTQPGQMVLVLGTSFCHMTLHPEARLFEGIVGMVRDGIVPGYYGYESGQTAGGDIYAWFIRNCVPGEYRAEAEERGTDIHGVLSERASRLHPAQSGLLALDWWNGNRSILMDAELSGALVGLTLDTRPEEIYRACIEGTMFGTRRIVDAYRDGGIEIEEFIACGGLPNRNPFAMQLLADVLNRPVQVAASEQTAALGSALLGATAAGQRNGGFESIEAAAALVPPPREVYRPRPDSAPIYADLYREYVVLHDYFGRGERVMHRLRALQG